jgi:hypothetical protein
MLRSVAISMLIASALVQADVAYAQAPPLCPQGSWPVRAKTASGAPNAGWVCTKTIPNPQDPPSSSSASSSPNSRSGGRHGGGMPQ